MIIPPIIGVENLRGKVVYVIYDVKSLFKCCALKDNSDYLIKRLYDNKMKGIINEEYNGSARKAYIRNLVKLFGGTFEIIQEQGVFMKDIQFHDNTDELKQALDRYNSGGGVDAIYLITTKDGKRLLLLIEDKMQTPNRKHYIQLSEIEKNVDKRWDRTFIRNLIGPDTMVINIVFISFGDQYTQEALKYLYQNYMVVQTKTFFTTDERFGYNKQKYYSIKTALDYSLLGNYLNIYMRGDLSKYTEQPNKNLFPNLENNKIPCFLCSILINMDSIRYNLYDSDIVLFKLPSVYYVTYTTRLRYFIMNGV